ncbi:MAG TPA: FprA family A-type flavoprotein [Armatimonadota bacterium]|jgi:flavorubredoxin
MTATFQALPISEHVYWVGAIDWNLRDFHGYATPRGSTYNAFLIMADRVTLIDTVKAPFKDEMLARIASVIDPARIDYLISNHAEMDHSGCLPDVIAAIKPDTVFASPNGVTALANHFHLDREIVAVKDGEALDLGNLHLSFVETRMLHWPDSMFTFLHEDGVLFSSDAFGMHLATAERFDDEIDPQILEEEAGRYFANILLPYSALITKLLEKVGGMQLPLQLIAPDHGPLWRGDLARILRLYGEWAEQKPTKKAVIVYDTMWGSTEMMARAIADGLQAGGATPRLLSLKSANRSDIAHEILDAGALLVGSPTLNNNLFPTIADVLTYLKGLRPRNLLGAAFGSFGWGGEAVGQIQEILTAMKVEIVAEPLKLKYVPTPEDLTRCYDLGQTVAAALYRTITGL